MNEEYFEYAGVWWVYKYNDELGGYIFEGPRCMRSDCKRSLFHVSENAEEWKLECRNCKKVYILPIRLRYDTYQEELRDAYEAEEMKHKEAIPLDRKPVASTKRVETKNYDITVKVREEAGQETAYIYIAKKGAKDNTEGRKAQLIVDITDEELRHDSSDMPPSELLSEIKVVFRKSETERKYNA